MLIPKPPRTAFLALEGLTQAQVTQIAEASVDYIKNGFVPSSATSAAKSLKSIGLGTSQATLTITAVAKTLAESANRGHNEQFFLRSLVPYALGEHVRKALCTVYLTNQKVIYEHTPDRGSSTRSYSDMQWRLSIEIARRSLQGTADPHYNVSVATSDGSTIEFVSSPAAMVKMEEVRWAGAKRQHIAYFESFQAVASLLACISQLCN